MKKQVKLKAKGETKLIGQILVEERLIDEDTLNGIITEQIVELRNALVNANQKLEERVRERTNELENTMRKLEELNQTKSTILSNLSHEFMTPLNHMKGYLELLKTDSLGRLNREQSDAINVIQKSYTKLETLITDLLQFSEASHGNLFILRKTISILEFLKTPIKSASNLAFERKIKLIANLPDSAPMVIGDPEKLTSVMNQLLDNALKFTPPGGTVTITAEARDNRVIISVSDTGIGIASDKLDEIFEPFHQLDQSTARRYGGTGLGMAIVKRILEEHDAKYQLSSKVNEGTSFIFELTIA
ncbi:MAG: HAMP domain-containing histidine kinase [Anaerolineaceae bacterium]|nr:HAMP domain-containing histidine kinase [Anaerolineaceae bacterium]